MDLSEIIAQGEGPTVDFKRDLSSPDKAFDEEPQAHVALADLDGPRLTAALEPFGVEISEEKLEALGVLVEYQGRMVATNGGVILFGPDRLRRRLFADARVDGARFAGTTRAANIEDLIDGETLTILEAVRALEQFIGRNTRRAEPIPPGEISRQSVPEYGENMVREFIVNAVAHADYAATGEPVKVFVFDDRIELHSPGLMLPGMTIDSIRRGRSKIRNRAIATVFRKVRIMERFGTAWAKIQDEVALGYREPTFDDSTPVFCTTLWPHPTFARTSGARDGGDGGDGGVQSGVVEAPTWRERQKAALEERRARLLDAIRAAGGLDIDQLVSLAGVSRPTVERDLRALRTSHGVAIDDAGRYRLP